jgi:hypothetical protein
LNILTNPITQPNAETAYANQFYNTYEAPAVAQQATTNYQTGMQNSSAGGAQLGQLQAQGQAQAGLQGQQYYTQALNNFLNTRSNFFGNEGGLAENSAQGQLAATQANQQVASQLAGYAELAPQLANQYQLAASGMGNQFDLGKYSTQAGIYGNQLQNNASVHNANIAQFGLLGK